MTAELREGIEQVKARDKELSFRSARTNEYLNQFVWLSLKDAQELREGIEKLDIPRLKPEHVIKIVDLFPVTPEEVKTVLSGYALTISNDNCKKIADLVKEYQPRQKQPHQPETAPPQAE